MFSIARGTAWLSLSDFYSFIERYIPNPGDNNIYYGNFEVIGPDLKFEFTLNESGQVPSDLITLQDALSITNETNDQHAARISFSRTELLVIISSIRRELDETPGEQAHLIKECEKLLERFTKIVGTIEENELDELYTTARLP